jgi:glycosyltransferase involved in cell wall biosynthesis
MTRVSVIIPALNEEARIAATIDAARAAGVDEIIVADGGSTDATVSIAQSRGARVISGERMRARQMNRGAAARRDVLIFLHADTLLPPGAASAVIAAERDCGDSSSSSSPVFAFAPSRSSSTRVRDSRARRGEIRRSSSAATRSPAIPSCR